MTFLQAPRLDRRHFLATACAATAHTADLDANHVPPARASYSIPPVRAWNPQDDSFAPFFPVGWYSFGPSARIEEIAENAANTALYAGLGTEPWHANDTLGQLDVAREQGIKVVLGFANSVIGRVVLDKPATHGVLPAYVETFNQHPAVLGWQLGDEFSPEAAPRINDASTLLQRLGSKHPTWQVHPHTWSHDQVRTLMANTDVCSYDGYTYLEGQTEFTPHAAARILAWQQAKADLIQTEGWSGNVNVTQAVGCKCGTAKFRFPTRREYRWNVFSPIATAGARGTLNWIYAYWGGFYADDPERFFAFRDEIVKPVNREQQTIVRAMETGYNIGDVQSNLDQPTRTAIPPAGGNHRPYNQLGHVLLYDHVAKNYFLIVSNNENKTQHVALTITQLPTELSSLVAHDSYRRRSLELQHGGSQRFVLRDQLSPFAVAIYSFA